MIALTKTRCIATFVCTLLAVHLQDTSSARIRVKSTVQSTMQSPGGGVGTPMSIDDVQRLASKAPAFQRTEASKESLDDKPASFVEAQAEAKQDVSSDMTPEAFLDSISKPEREDFVHIWGHDRLIEVIKIQLAESQKDNVIVGFSNLHQDLFVRQSESFDIQTESKANHPGQTCSEFPDEVLSHLWRYRLEDVETCLGSKSEKFEAGSLLESGGCADKNDEIPHSDGWRWRFSRCSRRGAVKCSLAASGRAGCCCPAGSRWKVSEGKCVACTPSRRHSLGETCTLRCALLPNVNTTLTCGKGVKLEGLAPEGKCRWSREEPVKTEAGYVVGFKRPMLWKWNLTQYGQNIPGGENQAGIESTHVRTFWGIPFGKPAERFRRPQKVDTWGSEPLELPDYYANGYKVPHCEPDGVADCLTLSIDVPPDASKASPRPVMFWIPGTGFRNADFWAGGLSPSPGFYDGARYALRQDALLVVANGRSSVFGHWASKALAEEDADSSTGNYGMMDQRLALQWIKTNIEQFGGDPNRVTIGGHSSGGFSVNFHLYSPQSRGLFDGAITDGSTFDSGWYFQNLDDATNFYAEVGVAMGCPKEDPSEQIRCLRKLPSSNFSAFSNGQLGELGTRLETRFGLWTGIKKASGFLWSLMGFKGGHPAKLKRGQDTTDIKTTPLWPILAVGPVVDGSEAGLPAAPFDLMHRQDGVAAVPIFQETAENEGTIFAMMMLGSYPWQDFPTFSHVAVNDMLAWTFGDDAQMTQELLRHYPTSMATPYSRLARAITDSVFKCSHRRFASAVASRPDSPKVYLAETDFDPSLDAETMSALLWGMRILGVNHLETPSIIFAQPLEQALPLGDAYEAIDQEYQDDWTLAQQAVSMQLNCHYAFFLHCGNPNITASSECYEKKIKGSQARLRSCLAPENDKSIWTQSFEAFNPAAPTKFKMQQVSQQVPWQADETARCDFWDSHPPSKFRFVPNLCRGCKDMGK